DNSQNHTVSVSSTSQNVLASQQFAMNLANRGLNESNGNIGGGSIATGSATSGSEMAIEANINQTELDLGGVYGLTTGGDLDLTNTGRNATIDNSLNLSTMVYLSNTNTLRANQSSFGLANSGLNFSHGNVNGGSIATGLAASGSEFDLMANK